MIQTISKSVINIFRNNNIIGENEDNEIYAYGLELIISSFINIISVLIISAIMGKFVETIAFFLAFIPIRTYAGGYHAKTHLMCFTILMAVYTIVLVLIFFIPENISNISIMGSSVCSFAMVAFFAPIEDINKELTNTEKTRYKKISIIIVAIQFITLVLSLLFLSNNGISLGFALGQLSAALSLVAVKKIKIKGVKCYENY